MFGSSCLEAFDPINGLTGFFGSQNWLHPIHQFVVAHLPRMGFGVVSPVVFQQKSGAAPSQHNRTSDGFLPVGGIRLTHQVQRRQAMAVLGIGWNPALPGVQAEALQQLQYARIIKSSVLFRKNGVPR